MRTSIAKQLFTDNWPIRRRWLRIALIWMALNVQAILVAAYFKIEISSSAIYQNAVITLLTAIVSLLGFYVFGAVWDDKDKRQRFHRAERVGEPCSEQDEPEDDPEGER
jgi:membrane protein YdbS with pleckstrin-like domain